MTDVGDDEPRDPDRECNLAALFEALEDCDLQELSERLSLYAKLRLFRSPAAASFFTPRDYVHEAFESALDGRRRFPAEKGISPYTFFRGVIDSLISHEADRPEQKVKHLPIEASWKDEEHPGIVESQLDGEQPDPELEAIAADQYEHFVAELDPLLRTYTELRKTEKYSSAEEYAIALGTEVNVIRNLDRKLARRRARWNRS